RFQRPPELAAQDVEEISLELDVQGQVETELMTNRLELRGPRVGAGHETGGIPGDDAHGDEDDGEDPEQHREQEEQAAADQADHGRVTGRSASGGWGARRSCRSAVFTS